jgi:DNA ligase-1
MTRPINEEATLTVMLPLYKRDSKGKVRVIQHFVKGNTFWAVHGLEDGEQIHDTPTVCEGKNIGKANETSPEQQALLESTARRQKKIDTGYFEDKSQIDNVAYFDPMLAKKWEDCKDAALESRLQLYSQPKLDGMRCIIRWEDDELVARSRNGKLIVPVSHILLELAEFLPKNVILDGELYNHELKQDFNKIISVAKKTKPTQKDIDEAEKLLEYHVYDCYIEDSTDTIFARRNLLFALILGYTTYSYPVDTTRIDSEDEIDKIYGEYLELGYEGQMIRIEDSYQKGKRSKSLLKRKEFIDDEFTIIGTEEGNGKKSGMAATFRMVTADGKEFGGSIKGEDSYRIEILANKDSYVGKKAHVRFFEYTPDGIPRFPVVHSVRDYE